MNLNPLEFQTSFSRSWAMFLVLLKRGKFNGRFESCLNLVCPGLLENKIAMILDLCFLCRNQVFREGIDSS